MTLPYMPVVDNRGALWPIFRDTDFIPDSVGGRPITGSKAWQLLGTKYITSQSYTDTVHPGGVANNMTNYILFVDANVVDVRFYTNNAGLTLYAKANDFPTITDYDVKVSGGNWLSLKVSLPGFATGTTWFYSVLNETPDATQATTTAIIITDETAPNGTFFPTRLDDDGNAIGQLEGYSYNFDDPHDLDPRPIPLLGYCIYRINVRRLAADTGNGIALAPSTGTADVIVKLGIMAGFSFDAQGVFTELQSITIPAGQPDITADVFLPVLSGTPLVYQSADQLFIRPEANFQPAVSSLLNKTTANVFGTPQTIGYYNGTPQFDFQKALLSFYQGFTAQPITLPLCAEIYNDLETVLNLL